MSLAPSAALLLAGNPSEVLRRAGENIRLLTTRLLDVAPETAEALIRRFTHDGLDALNRAIAEQIHHGHARRSPLGLAFQDVRVSVDRTFDRLTFEVGGADFVDTVDFRATGVVFDVQGSGAVHRPRPGIFVDTGERGAAIAERLIETVRRDLPDFGSGEDTQDVVVLIRADRSDFNGHRGTGETLDFDLLIPFGTLPKGGARGIAAPKLNMET